MDAIETAARDGNTQYIKDNIDSIDVSQKHYSALRWALQNSHREAAQILLDKNTTDCFEFVCMSALHGNMLDLLVGKIKFAKKIESQLLFLGEKSKNDKELKPHFHLLLNNIAPEQCTAVILKLLKEQKLLRSFVKKHLPELKPRDIKLLIDSDPEVFQALLEKKKLNCVTAPANTVTVTFKL